MKILFVVPLLLVGLGGCVAYVPHGHYGGGYGYREPIVHVQPGPIVIQPGYGSPRRHRDRDGDGIPNRYDRRPDSPRR